MSRGFAGTDSASKDIVNILQSQVSPTNIEQTLRQPDYNRFFQLFEVGAHNAIPQLINGDWLAFTAPNGQYQQ